MSVVAADDIAVFLRSGVGGGARRVIDKGRLNVRVRGRGRDELQFVGCTGQQKHKPLLFADGFPLASGDREPVAAFPGIVGDLDRDGIAVNRDNRAFDRHFVAFFQ
jgi:hypothetical protein